MTGGRLPRRTQEADDHSRQRQHLSDDVLEKLFHRNVEQLFDEFGHDPASGVANRIVATRGRGPRSDGYWAARTDTRSRPHSRNIIFASSLFLT